MGISYNFTLVKAKQTKNHQKMVATPKAVAPKAAKKPAVKAAHPPYKQMVCAAIVALKTRGGSSRQAIAKYIQGNFKEIKNINTSLKKSSSPPPKRETHRSPQRHRSRR